MPHANIHLLPSPKDAAATLGGDLLLGGKSILCPGPGHSEHDRSLSVRFDANAPDGFVVNSFTGDDPLVCKDYVRQELGLPEFGSGRRTAAIDHAAIARRRAEAEAKAATEAEKRRDLARYLWSSVSRPGLGSPAARYLRERRKLDVVPDAIRYMPATHRYPPAMIVAYGLPTEPEPGRYAPLPPDKVHAVHVTRLAKDGTDRDRSDGAKYMIASPGTMPIALIPPNDAGHLIVAEGVETALSYAHLGTGVWAAGSKDRLVTIAPTIAALPCIEVVTISADEDDPARVGSGFTSRDRAEELAERLLALRPNIEVRIA